MDKEKQHPASSGVVTHPISIGCWATGCIVAALFDQTALALLLGFITAVTGCAWLWGRAALSRISYKMTVPTGGVFPGQAVSISRKLVNNKLLPLLWLELLEPCNTQGCVLPNPQHIVTNPERVDDSPAEMHRCLYTFSLLKWHETIRFTDIWHAQRRGILRISSVTVRSGDGFGLSVKTKTLSLDPPREIVVYPPLMDVAVEKILSDMWDSRSSSKGYLEDTTLIRTVRDYLPGDPARRINYRLLARGQGLKVNQFEIVAPDSVLFLLDPASFNGQEPDKLEDTLSVIASLLVGLTRRGIAAGLIAPESTFFGPMCVAPSCDEADLARMLTLLSAAAATDNPLGELNTVGMLTPQLIGQVYYVTYSAAATTSASALSIFPPHKAQLLAWETGVGGVEATGMRVRNIRQIWRAS